MNRMYQLYELRDQIPEGIKNASELLAKEQKFIDLVNKSENPEEFEFMLKDFKEEMKSLEGQIDRMKARLPILEELIGDYEKQDEKGKIIAETVSKVLEAIGATTEPENEIADN